MALQYQGGFVPENALNARVRGVLDCHEGLAMDAGNDDGRDPFESDLEDISEDEEELFLEA